MPSYSCPDAGCLDVRRRPRSRSWSPWCAALTDGLHPLQVVFFRTAFGLLAMLPWLLRQGFGVLRTAHLRQHLLRALVAILAMVGWFTTR